MNINHINKGSSDHMNASSNQKTELSAIGEKGQTIEGVITKVSDKISIKFGEREINLPKSAIANAKEGEVRTFEIMNVSEKNILLRETGDSKGVGNEMIKIKAPVNILTDQSTFKDYLEKAQSEKGAAENLEQDVKDNQEKLDDIAARMTEQDYEELMKEGSVLEAYEIVRLDRALERVKENRSIEQETLQKQTQSQEAEQEQIEKTASSTNGKTAAEKAIADKLKSADLPVTEENIAKIANALELAGNLDHISEKDMVYLISNDLKPTISNLYKAAHSSGNIYHVPLTENQWNEIKGQAQAILTDAGIEVTNESMLKARWLLDHNLALTKQNIISLNQLSAVNETIGKQNSKTELLNQIITSVSLGNQPEHTQLSDGIKKTLEEVLDIINSTSNKSIEKAVETTEDISLSDLKKANETTAAGDSNAKEGNSREQPREKSSDIRVITVRRQLEEIRLKMTMEAAGKLKEKGFDLQTDSLKKIVEGLKEQENNYYRSLLKDANAADTANNLSILKETTQKIAQLRELPSYILGSTMHSREIQTIDSLCIQGKQLESRLNKANESYDTLMTAPRKDLGDSIQKAFSSVDSILNDLNLETTDANRRAVKILGYNQMPIDAESMAKVKEYDAKMNRLMKDLHPAATIEMIKEGINPIEMPVDDLMNKVNDIKKDLNVTEEERYSKYLWKLEKENGITLEQKKAYIGIYRLLNNVQKTDGAALGAVLNAGQEVTLKNLLTAVRTMKSNGIDAAVDDTFGRLESLTFSKETITDQVNAAFSQDNKSKTESEYLNTVVEHIMDEITPGKLNELAGTKEMNLPDEILNMTIERFSDEIDHAEGNKAADQEYFKEKVKRIQDLAQDSEESLRFLQKHEIPASIENLEAAGEFLKGGSLYSKVKNILNNASEEDKKNVTNSMEGLVDSVETADTLAEQFHKFDESVSQILKKQLEEPNITAKDIADLKQLSNGIHLVQSLGRSRTYEIPILTGDQVTNVNLTIVDGTKDIGKIDISVSSEKLGSIEANFSVKGDEVKGLVLCDSRESLEFMKAGRNNLQENISQTGLTLKQMNYGMEHKISESYTGTKHSSGNKTKADTHLLYQTAKAFICNIREAEIRKEW